MDSYQAAPKRPLPRLRRVVFGVLGVSSAITLVMSAVVLQYSLTYTGTYLKSNPEVLFASAFNLLCIFFALTVGRHTFFTQVWCELAWMAVSWFLYLGGDATLNKQTPGLLLQPCTSYFLCRGLLVMFIFATIALVLLTFTLFPILILAFLQHLRRRGYGSGVWTSRVEHWEGWRGGWTWEGKRERRADAHRSGMSMFCAGQEWERPHQQERKSVVLEHSPHVLEDPIAKDDFLHESEPGSFAAGIPHLVISDDSEPNSFASPPPSYAGHGDEEQHRDPFARRDAGHAV